LRRLRRESENSEFAFITERRSPSTEAGFAKMSERLGEAAGLKFGVHPHMLRHATGDKLANDGVDRYKPISATRTFSTPRADTRFKEFWRD
jgi:site-specific recombinase XerD